MASLEAMFADYASYHQTRGNKWCHRIGIPLIMFSLFGMLERVTLFANEGFRLDAALALIALATIYYFILLIGPLWVLDDAVGLTGRSRELV